LIVLSVVCSEIKNPSESRMPFSFFAHCKLPEIFSESILSLLHHSLGQSKAHHSAMQQPKKIAMVHQSIYLPANTISESLIA
jgi:hypothetical protein